MVINVLILAIDLLLSVILFLYKIYDERHNFKI